MGMSALTLAVEGANDLGFPVLTALVVVPIIGTFVIALIPRSRPEMHRLTSIVTALIAAAISLWVLVEFQTGDPGFQFRVSQTWVSSLDIKFALGIDGISLFLVVLTAILFPLAEAVLDERGQVELCREFTSLENQLGESACLDLARDALARLS